MVSKQFKLAIFVLLFDLGLFLILFLANSNVAVLNPKGIIASKERTLILTSVLLMFVVMIPMLFTAYFFAWRYRAGRGGRYEPEGDNGVTGGVLWALIPSIVVGALMFLIWRGAHDLDPHKPITVAGVKPLTIQVVALNWKWLFIYPEQGIATVNFIEFPQNTPVAFELTADGPMNSFWIPQLGGQMYAMGGMTTQLHLMADGIGEYNGLAAEINGKGFSGMKFIAKSSTKDDFDIWVAAVKESSSKLTLEEYSQLAQPSEDNPAMFYSYVDKDLYKSVINKFLVPSGGSMSSGGLPQSSWGSKMPAMHM